MTNVYAPLESVVTSSPLLACSVLCLSSIQLLVIRLLCDYHTTRHCACELAVAMKLVAQGAGAHIQRYLQM